MESYSTQLQYKSVLYWQPYIPHNKISLLLVKHGGWCEHVLLEVFVMSGWWSCSLSDASLILTQIRPHCLEETVSPCIRDMPLSIADSHADRCSVILRAPLFNSSVIFGVWVTLGPCDWCIGFCQMCCFEEKAGPATLSAWVVPKFEVVRWSVSGEVRLPSCPGIRAFFILLISLDCEMELCFVSRHHCQKCPAPKSSKYLTVLVH